MRIPIRLALIAALAQVGCLSSSSGHLTAPPVSVTVTRITPNAPATLSYSGYLSETRAVIDNAADLAAAWSRALALQADPPAPPDVDFTHDRVLLVALGERATGGYGIEVARADRVGSDVVVEVLSTSPGRGCVVSDALTQPVDIVKIPRDSGTVRFEESTAVRDCGR